jgi:hypothetical protein
MTFSHYFRGILSIGYICMTSSKRTASLLFLLSFISCTIFAQHLPHPRLFLKNRLLFLSDSIPKEIIFRHGRQKATLGEKSLVIIQFSEIPDEAGQMRLKQSGIELLEYIPDNAYTAVIVGEIDWQALKEIGVRAVFKPGVEDIVEPLLLAGIVPEHARKVPGKIDVTFSFAKSFTFEEVIRDIHQVGFELLSDTLKSNQILDVRIPEGSVRRLAEFPWVQYIEPVLGPTEMLNDKSAASTKANVLASTAILGYKLSGEGVVIGLGDFSDPVVHPDIGRRVIGNMNPTSNFWHGIHVGGTVAGSGLLNEKYRGYAPGSKIVSKWTSQIWENSAQYVQDYGMVVTSNTYGGSSGCGGFGSYSQITSSALDQQAFQYPSLLHVFSAGNSGLSINCNGLPVGFGTVLGDYQSAKNVLTVGMTQADGVVNASSSKGPVEDGRIKPEVTAPGTSIYSAMPGNTYQAATGTSMAAPAVTGGAALLYQRYRQLHQQNNPKNALIKALICNGASDQGLPGPDYSYGFGQMNLLRSVTMLDKGHYFNGTIAHLATKNHEIVVPANTARLKVLIYWNDSSPSPLAGGSTLVNDLDIAMIRPGNIKMLPKFPVASAPTAAAVAGVDSVNNIEQIVLDAPAAGTYSVQVTATKIPQGVQEYFIVYDIIEPSLTVTYPLAGERLTKGDAVNICWDAYGDELSTFNVAYSLDNGAAWTTLHAGVAPDKRQLTWTVPDGMTGKAKVRVTRNGGGLTNVSGPFAILGVPAVALQSAQCEGYIALQWNAIAGAFDYEVMLSTGDEMKAAGVTNGLNYTLAGLSKDSTYYVSVRARKDQVPGRRSFAIIRKPDSGTCRGAISDNDLKMEAVLTPLPNARMFTKAAYSAEHSITISIKNLDDQPQTKPFEVGYSLGGAMHWESVNVTLPPTTTTDYTFKGRVNLSAVNEATLLVRVRLAGDPVKTNDSLIVKLRQIANPKLVLPHLQDVESLPVLDIRSSASGIQGAEAYDFTTIEGKGRLRTAVDPAIGYLSQSAFVLDLLQETSAISRSYLEGTYNLSGYRVKEDDIRLSFRHTYWYSYYHDFNKVFIRGSSIDPWILAYSRDAEPYGDIDNGYKLVSVEVTQLLRNNGQEFTADFQVRWACEAFYNFPDDGYAIDDIRLFKTKSDVELVRLDAPSISICNANSLPAINAVFKNNGTDDCFNVPVKLSIDGKIAEYTIDVIRKGDSTTIKMYYPIEIYQEGKHLLKVWCEKGADTNLANDTLKVEIFTPGAITAMPYLENFELGNGGWYAMGTNTSWQFGKPNSAGVSNAASGQNAWKTNLTGFYNNNEESYLYSPCFNLQYPFNTYLSFSARMDLQSCDGDACDMFYLEYDSGYGWRRLGAKGYGTNWYSDEKEGLGFWSGKVADEWRVFTVLLPTENYVRIRFVFKSNGTGNGEGVAIDDIHIYNMRYDVYGGGSVPSGIGAFYMPDNNWTDYAVDNGIVASVHPRGQDISSINVRTFLNEGPLRVSEGQIVLDRNFVINSNSSFEKPVGVRLYVPDTNIERLVSATDHPDVVKPKSVYDLAVTKYSGANQDGDLANNTKDAWDYFPHDKVAKVPFGSGYYLEFETSNFSEFWLAKGYVGTGTPLPVELISFTVQKSGSGEGASVFLKWSTASETDFSHFVVQVAVGTENVKKGLFYDLGTIAGQGTNESRQYTFLDDQATFQEVRYYRLKMVDHTDGNFQYSSIRSVAFDHTPEWQVFPNPSNGIFRLEPKRTIAGPVLVEVIDLKGILRKKIEFQNAPTFLEVDLRSSDLADGLYVINVKSKEGERRFKVVKK